jgi:hypothetical protein
MSVVEPILLVFAASYVIASISAKSSAIPHQWAIQWATVWTQKFDNGSIDDAQLRQGGEKCDYIWQSQDVTKSGNRSEISVGADYRINTINQSFWESNQKRYERIYTLLNHPVMQFHSKASHKTLAMIVRWRARKYLLS